MWWPAGAVICAALVMAVCVIAGMIMLALGPAAALGEQQAASADLDRRLGGDRS